MRKTKALQIPGLRCILSVIESAKRTDPFCFLEGIGFSSFNYEKKNRMALVAFGILEQESEARNLIELDELYKNEDWIFGHIAYDYKNKIEKLRSENQDGIGFSELRFYRPKFVLEIYSNETYIHFYSKDEEELDGFLNEIQERISIEVQVPSLPELKCRYTKEEYLSVVEKIKEHLRIGDVYELNLCIEFFAEKVKLIPSEIFLGMYQKNRMPFAGFYQDKNQHLLCFSPERFIRKEGSIIRSEPMKGTVRRGTDLEEDDLLKKQLQENEKERAENIMIVDLVRNDLSKLAKKGSVKVDELCEVYAFLKVHQMISKVSAELKENVKMSDVFSATFPMGSMTGAPKIRAMELIEAYERTKRGLYSGSIGYMNPKGDFDFNVVIRSIQYNSETEYVSYQAGGAITFLSNPLEEYQECLLKSEAFFEFFNQTKHNV